MIFQIGNLAEHIDSPNIDCDYKATEYISKSIALGEESKFLLCLPAPEGNVSHWLCKLFSLKPGSCSDIYISITMSFQDLEI